MELVITQSNHEGALIDFLHDHIDTAQGALVNPQAGMKELIGIASNPANLCQMEPNWQAWL